jgi:hypothetical protein
VREDASGEIFYFIPYEPNNPAPIEIAIALRREFVILSRVKSATDVSSAACDESASNKIAILKTQ